MIISGFTFARNAVKLGYPVVESIQSILSVCDEFIVALGDGDSDDTTEEAIQAINNPKIRVVKTTWENIDTLRGSVYSVQTNIALNACRGDWCFYLQSDEVVHEKYLDAIGDCCLRHLNDSRIEGLLFRYKHFWGDYDHYMVNHKWYPREIRIVRNNIGVQSIGDAQSFRIGTRKCAVAPVPAEIYHYGYVRDPALMERRNKTIETTYHGAEAVEKKFRNRPEEFDYGSLAHLPVFRDSYPAVMKERIASMDWKHKLQYAGPSRVRHKHDRLKYRILTFLEQRILGGRQVGGYKNYVVVKKRKQV